MTWPQQGGHRPSRAWEGCECGLRLIPVLLQFGEHFEFDCKDCVCLEGGSGIVCHPKKCPSSPGPKCTEEGTYPVIEADPAQPCCNTTSCSKGATGSPRGGGGGRVPRLGRPAGGL